MAIKNLSYTFVKASFLILLSIACAQTQKRGGEPKEQEVPAATKTEEQKPVAIIFGPGGLKSFAHIGVIRNLQREEVVPERLVGLEWGAMMAAIYARKLKVHDVEWQMSKLKDEHLPSSGFFKNKIDLENPNRINLFIERVFPAYDLAQSTVPFSCPTTNFRQENPSWLQSGPAYKDLKKCIAYPPLFYSYNSWHADALAIDAAITKLRQEKDYHIILVNVIAGDNFQSSAKVIDQEAEKILWKEIATRMEKAASKVDSYISINTSEVSILDLSKTKRLIQLGEEQSASAILNIKR
tara:strand:+ start:3158 stop:4045 length:888 start_codon:yes stop_codon:yes gene_type:complete